jgi:hypothetical protein
MNLEISSRILKKTKTKRGITLLRNLEQTARQYHPSIERKHQRKAIAIKVKKSTRVPTNKIMKMK